MTYNVLIVPLNPTHSLSTYGLWAYEKEMGPGTSAVAA